MPLDDCLYALQPTIPHLTRSALHRCLERHGISRLPKMEGDKLKIRAHTLGSAAPTTRDEQRSDIYEAFTGLTVSLITFNRMRRFC